MGKHYERIATRLEGREAEVIEYTRTYGRFKSMVHFEISSFDRWVIYLENLTGEKNFGANPLIKSAPSGELGSELLDAFLCKLATVLEANVALRAKVKRLQGHHELAIQLEEQKATDFLMLLRGLKT